MRFIFEYFWRHSWHVFTLIQNNSEFLVCLSVCYFVTSLMKLDKYGDVSIFGWDIFLNFFRHSWDTGSLVFTLLGWTYILTFEFLCAGLNFETSDLVTFCLVGVSFWDLLVLLFLFLHVRFFIKMFSSIPPPLISPKLCSCNCEKLFPNSPPPYSAITNNFKPEPKSKIMAMIRLPEVFNC